MLMVHSGGGDTAEEKPESIFDSDEKLSIIKKRFGVFLDEADTIASTSTVETRKEGFLDLLDPSSAIEREGFERLRARRMSVATTNELYKVQEVPDEEVLDQHMIYQEVLEKEESADGTQNSNNEDSVDETQNSNNEEVFPWTSWAMQKSFHQVWADVFGRRFPDENAIFRNDSPMRISRYNSPFIQDSGTVSSLGATSVSEEPRFKVLVTHRSVPQEALDRLKTICKLVFIDKNDTWRKIKRKTKGIDGIFLTGNWIEINKTFLRDMVNENLKVVATMNHQYDNMDVRELMKKKIRIGTTRSLGISSMAEMAVGLALAVCYRFLNNLTEELKTVNHVTEPDQKSTRELFGSVCGIVGNGRIIDALYKLLQRFRCKKIITTIIGRHVKKQSYLGVVVEEMDSPIEIVEFQELVTESDFIFVACPLLATTLFLFNLEVFKKMKSTSILVDISNQGVVNDNHLAIALEQGLILGAAIDVTYPTELPQSHPLLHMKNCIVTPRISNANIHTRHEMALMTANNILAGLTGDFMPSEACFKVRKEERPKKFFGFHTMATIPNRFNLRNYYSDEATSQGRKF